MKRVITLIIFFICLVNGLIAGNFQGDTNLIVMTYNIRFNNPDDSINAWPNRKQIVTDLIRKQQPAIIGLQEALIGQIQDINAVMNEYAWVGVGRDDGKQGGEFTPIFYDKARLNLLNSSTFWLSATPAIAGTKSWDAACNRIVTWAKFIDKNTGKEFFVFNTHFDHIGSLARRNSSFILVNAIDSIAGKQPVILTGDFNVIPNSAPIMILTARNKPWLLVRDTRSLTDNRIGKQVTYMGFEVGKSEGELIDYIFVKNIRQVSWHKILNENNGKYYPSDHLPIVVKLSFAS
jgi:endonuclease/exonuclease/phosphatase family metal-dependent hydrolase